MFKNKNINSIVKKMQQGGLTVFAPEPNQYRAPVPGIDPSVYRYSNTTTFDVSPLVEMQKQQQALEVQRQNAALAREKMAHQTRLLERKQAMQEEKQLFDMFFGNYAKSGGQATDASGSPLYYGDARNSERFGNQFKQWEEAKLKLFDDMLYLKSLPYDTKNRSQVMARKIMDFQSLSSQLPATSALEADTRTYQRVMDTISKPTGAQRVNMPMFNKWQSNRIAYYKNEAGSDKLYQLGQVPPGLFYDYENGKKDFDAAMLKFNSPQEVSKRLDQSGNIITEVIDKKILDTDVAAERLAELVIANPNLRGYIQDQFGVSLYATDSSDPMLADDKKALIDIIKPLIKADDELQNFNVTEEAYKGQSSSTKSTPEQVKNDAAEYLKTYRDTHFDPTTSKMKTDDVYQSELAKAAASLTQVAVNVYGDDAEANRNRTKLDDMSVMFLEMGGDPNNKQQVDILRKYMSKVIQDEDYIFIQDEINNFKNELSQYMNSPYDTGYDTPWYMLGTRTVDPAPTGDAAATSSSNTSAADLARQLRQ